METLKRLTTDDIKYFQSLGAFDEHLIGLYSVAFGDPYVYEDTYSLYYDRLSKMLYLSFFELKESSDKIRYIETAQKKFGPEKMLTTSPEKLDEDLACYHCVKTSFDRDYQIHLPTFDESLKGNIHRNLRYRVNNAVKRGYYVELGREMSHAHYHLMASQAVKDSPWWDKQIYLSLKEYMKTFASPMLFNVFSKKKLIGFDLVDFLNDVIATPLGFYMVHEDYPSLADFILFKEIVYAKENSYTWLDLGWGCNPGVEGFKIKWMAEPKYEIWLQEYVVNRSVP